jgi:hypothetical protein
MARQNSDENNKVISPYISSPFCHIFNKALPTGIFPSCLKFAVIVPIYKKGDRKNITNYRPISVLTSLCKILEKIIYRLSFEHINKYNILTNEQHGFRMKCSTETAAYVLINEILTSLNNKKKVGGIFLT